MRNLDLIQWAGLALLAGGLLWLAVQRLPALWAKVPSLRRQADPETEAHAVYAALRHVRRAVSDCPTAVEAIDRIVLPAAVTGYDPPHYSVAWEGPPCEPSAPC